MSPLGGMKMIDILHHFEIHLKELMPSEICEIVGILLVLNEI